MALTAEEKAVIEKAFEIISKHTETNESAQKSVMGLKQTILELINKCERKPEVNEPEKAQAQSEKPKEVEKSTMSLKEKLRYFIFGEEPEKPERPEPPKPDVESSPELFEVEPYRDGVMITKYIGFDDKKIIFPKEIGGRKVVALGESLFNGITSLTEVIIPEGVVSIGDSCFSSCSFLQKVKLPQSMRAIGPYAFSGTCLTSITIPSSVYFIGSGALSGTQIEEITLPNGLYSIFACTFSGCRHLKKIVVPQGVAYIGDDAFYDCIALTSVSLPSGLIEIGEQAFSGCISLNSIDIPPSVKKIGKFAFTWKNQKRHYAPLGPKWKIYEYWKAKIVCAAGSVAQDYARNNDLPMEKSEKVYGEAKLNVPIYSVEDMGWRTKNVLDKTELLSKKIYCWDTLGKNHLCIKTDDPSYYRHGLIGEFMINTD